MLAPANRAARETAVVANLAVFRIAFPPYHFFKRGELKNYSSLLFPTPSVDENAALSALTWGLFN
jgi:hypothetical protein